MMQDGNSSTRLHSQLVGGHTDDLCKLLPNVLSSKIENLCVPGRSRCFTATGAFSKRRGRQFENFGTTPRTDGRWGDKKILEGAEWSEKR